MKEGIGMTTFLIIVGSIVWVILTMWVVICIKLIIKDRGDVKFNILTMVSIIALVVLTVGGLKALTPNTGIDYSSYDSSVKRETCGYCHKTYTNDIDVDSIEKTNLCSSCYESYKFGTEVKEAADYYREHY